MTKIDSASGAIGAIYFGFSDEKLPAPPLTEGTLFIFMDKPQIWIARSNQWTFLMPLNLSMTVPYGGIPDAVQIASGSGTTANRAVVALGASVQGQQMATLERAVETLIDQNNLIVTELRVMNLLLQGLNTMPVTDDLDQLREFALTGQETITR